MIPHLRGLGDIVYRYGCGTSTNRWRAAYKVTMPIIERYRVGDESGGKRRFTRRTLCEAEAYCIVFCLFWNRRSHRSNDGPHDALSFSIHIANVNGQTSDSLKSKTNIRE